MSELDRARGLSQAGDHVGASALLEQACAFGEAAREALLADDPNRAIVLAALGRAAEVAELALTRLAAPALRDVASAAASELTARGFHDYAARLLTQLGRDPEAARAYVAAGNAASAAACFERAGQPANAARALEAALAAQPNDAPLRLALAELLLRHGRVEAAAAALQQLDPATPEHAASLPMLARCFDALGLSEAARRVRAELPRSADEPPPSSARTPTPRRAADRPGTLLFGRYETVREVAVTAHAHVLEAIDLVTHERVAIQILREPDPAAVATGEPDGRHRFEQEARTLATLRHPNVVPLRAHFPTAHAAVFAWMAGGSLVDWMEREVASPARAVEISCGLLGALGEAHRLRILHGDVKPSNVFFDEIGAARLTGFGASHLSDQSATVTAHASALAALSPEQRLGQATTVASDLYGVGAILIELLTGEPAEPAERGRLVHAPSTRNADLGAAHDAAVAPLLERDPERRPADAFEARRRLEALDWPMRPPPREPRGRAHGSPPHAALSARLGPARSGADGRDADRRQHDAWLDRDVLTLALDDATLAAARAFARVDHPSLPCVLRVDPMRREIWVAAPLGRALVDEPRGLSHGQLARLRDAILALHAIGGAHGSIDLEHLYVHEGDISLAFPRSPVGEAARASDDAAMTAFHQR